MKNPLTLEEREKISEGLNMNMTYSQLALHTGRNKSTVLRESKRLGAISDYDPEKAQAHFEQTQREKRRKAKKICPNCEYEL